MANKGCNNCSHYNSGKLNMWKDDEPRSCKLGKNEELDKWWLENGNKTNKTIINDMPCYQDTELGILSGKLSELLDEMKKITDKK